VEIDPAKRKALFSQFQRIVDADLPAVNMVSPLEIIVANRKIRNYARGAEGLGDNFADVHFVD
jgi:peptide/nickel transport system substrate-binding protein